MTTPYYSDDLVTLFHGDCREIREWLDADVLVTDPPYGISMSTVADRNRPAIAGEPWIGQSSSRVIPPSHVAVRDTALELWGARPALVFGHWRAPRPVDTRMRLIWDKVIPGLGGVRPFRPTDEEIYLVGNWPNGRVGPRGSAVSSVLRHRALRGSARPAHPTPKPVPLMAELISYCPAGVVADPFVGSGSTLVAAKMLGRRAIGVELKERYCAMAAERLAQDALPLVVA